MKLVTEWDGNTILTKYSFVKLSLLKIKETQLPQNIIMIILDAYYVDYSRI